jgi:hypothetical protein
MMGGFVVPEPLPPEAPLVHPVTSELTSAKNKNSGQAMRKDEAQRWLHFAWEITNACFRRSFYGEFILNPSNIEGFEGQWLIWLMSLE